MILGLAAVAFAGVGAAALPVDARTGPVAVQAGCGGLERFAPGKDLGPGRAPLAIGDSVLLGAAEEVAALGYAVDVQGCRQMSAGIDVLRARARARKLPPTAVIALGTNWVVERRDLRAAFRILGPDRVLGLVTPREVAGESDADAKLLRDFSRCHPRRTILLDWVKYAGRRTGMTYDDGIHLAPAGQQGMADLLSRALPEALERREIAKTRC